MLTKIEALKMWWAEAQDRNLSSEHASVIPRDEVRLSYQVWASKSKLSLMPIEMSEFTKLLTQVVPGLGKMRPRLVRDGRKQPTHCFVFPKDDVLPI